VKPTIFGSTVGYHSDSLASCFIHMLVVFLQGCLGFCVDLGCSLSILATRLVEKAQVTTLDVKFNL